MIQAGSLDLSSGLYPDPGELESSIYQNSAAWKLRNPLLGLAEGGKNIIIVLSSKEDSSETKEFMKIACTIVCSFPSQSHIGQARQASMLLSRAMLGRLQQRKAVGGWTEYCSPGSTFSTALPMALTLMSGTQQLISSSPRPTHLLT